MRKNNVLFSSQLKKSIYEIASQRKNVDFYFYHGTLDELKNDKKMLGDINQTLKESSDYKTSTISKIIFIMIEHPIYYDVESIKDIKDFEYIIKKLFDELGWRSNVFFIINNKNIKKVPYEKQISSFTKEILLDNENINEKKQEENNEIITETNNEIVEEIEYVEVENIKNIENNQEEVIVEEKIEINKEVSHKPKLVDNDLNLIEVSDEPINNIVNDNILTVEINDDKNEEDKQAKYIFINDEESAKINKDKIDYDNIVWMDEENKHLFEGKEPKTRIVHLSQMDKKLNNIIKGNSSADEYMLEINKVKISSDK